VTLSYHEFSINDFFLDVNDLDLGYHNDASNVDVADANAARM
jgi:hypothetical protein